MSNDFEKTETPETVSPQKILRVGPNFGVFNPKETTFLMTTQTPFHEADILRIFQDQGFQIIRGGSFNTQNPAELAMGAKHSNEEIALAIGIEMPPNRPIEAVLATATPTVAKARYIDRGEHKYLLETGEQKARFLAWLVGSGRSLIHQLDAQKAQVELLALLEKAKTAALSETDYADADQYGRWRFEDYIASPSKYDTSYRLLVDAYGTVHYAQIHRSENVRGGQKAPTLNPQRHLPIFERRRMGDSYHDLLVHPRSPLFLDTTAFVSNIASGGRRILLNGDKATDETDRIVLVEHGIDPDRPIAPEYLLEKASAIGVLNRDVYPYVGVDFIQDRKSNFYFLEANAAPGINPEAIGLPTSSSTEERTIEMMEKVTAQAKTIRTNQKT